jgi:hypothetical protein
MDQKETKQEKPLTPKEIAFCHQYRIDKNGTDSMRRAGYKGKDNSLATGAYQLLRKPQVKALIDKLVREDLKRSQATADEVLREMSRVAMVDPSELIGEDGKVLPLRSMPVSVRRCIRSIEKDAKGNVKFTFWDKNVALTNLARHHKLLTDNLVIDDKRDIAGRLAKARARVNAAAAKGGKKA